MQAAIIVLGVFVHFIEWDKLSQILLKTEGDLTKLGKNTYMMTRRPVSPSCA